MTEIKKELQFMTTPPRTGESVAANDGKAIDETEQNFSPFNDLDQNTIPGEEIREEEDEEQSLQFLEDSVESVPQEGSN